jgi:predicted ArsR family transcriptional regulator
MTNDIKPLRTYSLKTEEQVKSYVHSTRLTILKMLARKKQTISMIAKELKVHPANITHHFKLLEKNGLIRLVEKRDTGRTLEKYYRAAAYSYSVRVNDNEKINKKSLALSILRDDLSIAIDSLTNDKHEAGARIEKKVIALIATARLKAKNIRLFEKKLIELIRECKKKDEKGGIAYNLNLSLYPNDVDYAPGNEEVIIE